MTKGKQHMTPAEKIEFFDKFIDIYLKMGFGGASKREIDLFVFHHLTIGSGYKSKSNYELANSLRIPESKIKQLKLHAGLKYIPINSKVILGELVMRITNTHQFKGLKDGEQIEISLEDPMEKRELENFLKLNDDHAEYTLNGEVLKISPIQLFRLLAENLDNPERQFTKLIQDSAIDQKARQKIISKGLSLKQKLDRLREEHLNIENIKSLIIGGIEIYKLTHGP